MLLLVHTVVWEKFDVKNFSSLVWHNENWMHEIFLTMNKKVLFYTLETPRDENILPRTNFTRKYPMVNIFQTTVVSYVYTFTTNYIVYMYAHWCTLNVMYPKYFNMKFFVDLWLWAFCIKYFADYKSTVCNCNASNVGKKVSLSPVFLMFSKIYQG